MDTVNGGFKQISFHADENMSKESLAFRQMENMMILLKVITKEAGLNIKFETEIVDNLEPQTIMVNGLNQTLPPGKRYTLKARY